MNESNLIQILIQGGMTSVALVSLWITYKLASNHIEHNTQSNNKLEVAITKLIQLIEDKLK